MGLGLDDSEKDSDLDSVEGDVKDESGREGEEEEVEGSDSDAVQFGAYEQKLLSRFEKYLHSSDEEMHEEGEEEGEGEGQLTDKSWGRSKRTFYSTDFIDDEIGGECIYGDWATASLVCCHMVAMIGVCNDSCKH